MVSEEVRTGFPLKGVACRLGSSIIKAAPSKKTLFFSDVTEREIGGSTPSRMFLGKQF